MCTFTTITRLLLQPSLFKDIQDDYMMIAFCNVLSACLVHDHWLYDRT